METIISITDIAKYRPIADDIPQDRILPYIKEAETIDLKDCLGEKLFNDFVANKTDAKYQTLINGGTYTKDDVTITYDGLIPMLCYFSLARFIPNSGNFSSATGFVKKTTDFSTPITAQETSLMMSELRSIGISYKGKVQAFLANDPTTYPYYNGYGEGLNNLSVKFFDA